MLPFKYTEIRNAIPKAPTFCVYMLWLALNALIAFVLLGVGTGAFYLMGFDVLRVVQFFGLASLACTVLIMAVVRLNRYLAKRDREQTPE